VPFGLIQGLDDAIGRYPSPNDGGPTWHGLIMDTNPPDDTHWWYRLSEVERPPEQYWQFFRQPGGLLEVGGEFIENQEAENLENLKLIDEHYYLTKSIGKTKAHIRVYYCNQYGFVIDGRPVHEEYADAVHCATQPFGPTPGQTVYVGIDFGLTPAAAFGQRLVNGAWAVFDEITTERMGITSFSTVLGPKIAQLQMAGYTVELYGDPAGSQESQTDEQTPFSILKMNGIDCKPAYHNNDPIIRRESLAKPMTRLIDGKPGFLLSPSCKMLRKALQGGYCYRKVGVVGEERYHEKPDKNAYSHIAEACEYMVLGAGEGLSLIQQTPKINMANFYMPSFSRDGQGWML
jgi:hypothetical protein